MTTTAWLTTVASYLETDYCDITVTDSDRIENGRDNSVVFYAKTNVRHDTEYDPAAPLGRVTDEILREAGWQRTEHPKRDDFDEEMRCYCEGSCDSWQGIESGASVTVERI